MEHANDIVQIIFIDRDAAKIFFYKKLCCFTDRSVDGRQRYGTRGTIISLATFLERNEYFDLECPRALKGRNLATPLRGGLWQENIGRMLLQYGVFEIGSGF